MMSSNLNLGVIRFNTGVMVGMMSLNFNLGIIITCSLKKLEFPREINN